MPICVKKTKLRGLTHIKVSTGRSNAGSPKVAALNNIRDKIKVAAPPPTTPIHEATAQQPQPPMELKPQRSPLGLPFWFPLAWLLAWQRGFVTAITTAQR